MPVRFLTNSTRKPKRQLLDQLRAFGIAIEANELFTPAQAASIWLEDNGYAPHLLVHPNLAEDFEGCATDGPKAVVVGDAGPYFNYQVLNAAFREIAKGATFLALAANRVFRDEDGELSMDAGAFVCALEYSSGVDALVLGKPAPAFFKAACASMGCEVSEAVMIGDDAESDIAGALNAGIGQAILVRTGKYRVGDERRFEPQPSAVADDVQAAVSLNLN